MGNWPNSICPLQEKLLISVRKKKEMTTTSNMLVIATYCPCEENSKASFIMLRFSDATVGNKQKQTQSFLTHSLFWR